MSSSVARSRTASLKWSRPRTVSHVTVVSQPSLEQDMFITGTPVPLLNQDTPRSLNWPLAQPRKSYECKSTAWRSDEELIYQVNDKVANNIEGTKKMFQFRDPHGDFIVTREVLFLILKSLVGHISRDQFNSFLKCINLHWRSSISFDEFIFHLQEKVQDLKGYISCQFKKADDISTNSDIKIWSPFSDIPQALVAFYKKLQKGELNIHYLLPASCFNYGQIFKHQFKNALRYANVTLSEQELKELWKKFEPDKNEAVSCQKFFTIFDLNIYGQPRSGTFDVKNSVSLNAINEALLADWQYQRKTESKSSKKQSSSVSVSKLDAVEVNGNHVEIIGRNEPKCSHKTEQKSMTQVKTTTKEVETITETTTTFESKDDFQLSPYVKKLLTANKTPSFADVLENLHYKFEETYRNLEAAFQLFDFMKDGYIARIDFRRVLKEFGYEISALELDAFLKGAGIGVVQGLINYRQFLSKYQSKEEDGILSKLKQKSFERKYYVTDEELRTDEKEKNVSNFFHSDYIRLLGLLKQKDKNKTGILPIHELRSAVNSVLEVNMTNDQFKQLLQKINKSFIVDDSAVHYEGFLDLFKTNPGKWNEQKNGSYVRQKYPLGEIAPPAPVLSLIEKSKTWMAPLAEKQIAIKSKLLEIEQKLSKLFTDRFHIFDKNFQGMDRKKSGYMTKWQLGALLKLSGITLSVKDLDVLWASLDTAADETLSYSVLVKTFTLKNQEQTRRVTSSAPKKSAVKSVASGKNKSPVVVSQQQATAADYLKDVKEKRLAELLHKIKDDVLSRWDVLMSIFLSKDNNGYSSVSVDEMKDICLKMKLALTPLEINELCNIFDIHSNGWFHYLAFLHYVKKYSNNAKISPCTFNIYTKHLHRKAGPTSMAVTIYEFLSELQTILLKKYKTLRGSFKFLDMNHNGFIEESELKKSLTLLGYALSDQDFLDIFQIFDASQSHCISFEDFKRTLLTI